MPTSRGSRCVPPYPGTQAELHLRLAEPRAFARNAQGAGHRELTATAERKSLDRGNHRLAAGLDPAKDALPSPCQLLALRCRERRQLADVGACGEGLLACPGQDDGPHRSLAGKRCKGVIELREERAIQRIHHLGAVERDNCVCVASFQQQVFVDHPALSPSCEPTIIRGARRLCHHRERGNSWRASPSSVQPPDGRFKRE